MPWFLTPHGPHFVVEPGTVDEYERRDYVVMTTQQVTDYYAGVAFPDPPSFATEAEVPGIVAGAVNAGTGPVAEALRAASDARYALKAAGFAQVGIYRQPTDPEPDVPVGAPYTWFQTDPTTGAVVDWLEGIGTKVSA